MNAKINYILAYNGSNMFWYMVVNETKTVNLSDRDEVPYKLQSSKEHLMEACLGSAKPGDTVTKR